MPSHYSYLIISALLLASCSQKQATPTQSPLRPVASIQEIMAYEVDPAADYLWASVGSVSSAAGSEDRQPRTDEEWKAARRQAITLVEATNLLVMPDRAVASVGRKLEDSHVAGILGPAQIEQAIHADHGKFVSYAHALQDAGLAALAAIDKHNADGLMAAGEKMDQACEQCHVAYWYPNQVLPKH